MSNPAKGISPSKGLYIKEGSVKNKAVYLALGIQRDGTKDVLGLWIQQTEGAKFWLAVMNELKNRAVQDIDFYIRTS
jgi:transposase-like protein